MGYQTNFDFSNNSDEIIAAIEVQSGYDESDNGQMQCKWYSWQEDMIEVSKLFPDTVIHLDGDGEESGDNWKAQFLNGEYDIVHVEMMFPPFTKFI